MLLRVSDISSSYGRIPALGGVDLGVDNGELVALIGANGAGKTTLLNVISGIQPVSGGDLRYDGEPLASVPAAQRVARGIVQVPEGRQVFAPLSVRENLELGAYVRSKAFAAAKIDEVFALFPILSSRQSAPAGTLSGGEQQMLAIGRALMSEPRVLLLDEPSLGLAPQMTEFIFEKIAELNANGVSILLVEQNASLALEFADRAYVLETGHIVMTGSGASLLGDPTVQSAYLGV
jgi:branched-chain amino acid transport system ATP-binding protein